MHDAIPKMTTDILSGLFYFTFSNLRISQKAITLSSLPYAKYSKKASTKLIYLIPTSTKSDPNVDQILHQELPQVDWVLTVNALHTS